MAIALLTLALVGTLSLAGTVVAGYGVTTGAAVRGHFLAALVTTLLLVMAHSFIMFFLIATGVELKDMEKDRGWGDSFRRRTIALKSRVFPVATYALLLVIANFILGAAAHTRAMPAWLHGVIGWATLLTCLLALYREYQVLGENNRLIAEAASRRGDRAAVPRA
jgi:hypothetical protein